MRYSVLPLVLALLWPSVVIADDNVPDFETLTKRIEAAAGVRPSNERSTIVTTRGADQITEQTWKLGRDMRRDERDGPFETQNGINDAQPWRQNENGVTTLVPKEPGNERKVQYSTSVRRVTTPIMGYVAEFLDPQGFGDREYVDGVTWRVMRRDYVARTGTTTYLYDDFRTVDGSTRPYHWTSSDGHPENATESHVTEDVSGVVTADDVKIPGFRRDLLTFAPGVDHVDLPVHMSGPRIIVRAMAGTRGLDFELDTGASALTLDADVAHQLGLKVYGTQSVVTAQRYQTGRAVIPVLTIGAFELHDVAVRVIPSLQGQGGDTKVVGLLGYDVLAQAAYKIDYENGRVTAFPSDKLVAPTDPGTIPLDVRLTTGQPLVTAAINGFSADRFVLDTGGDGTFLLFDYFVRRYPDALAKGTFGTGEDRLLGVGGAFATRPYRVATLTLGQVKFTGVDGYLVTSSGSYEGAQDGLIGSSFLRLFDVWLDYASSHIYLVPNATGRRAGA